jgi:hypothetical protein
MGVACFATLVFPYLQIRGFDCRRGPLRHPQPMDQAAGMPFSTASSGMGIQNLPDSPDLTDPLS